MADKRSRNRSTLARALKLLGELGEQIRMENSSSDDELADLLQIIRRPSNYDCEIGENRVQISGEFIPSLEVIDAIGSQSFLPADFRLERVISGPEGEPCYLLGLISDADAAVVEIQWGEDHCDNYLEVTLYPGEDEGLSARAWLDGQKTKIVEKELRDLLQLVDARFNDYARLLDTDEVTRLAQRTASQTGPQALCTSG